MDNMKGFGEQGDIIYLQVVGPKSLLPQRATIIEAKLNSTWYEVLREKLNLQLTPDRGIFACSAAYTPTAPKTGGEGGWRNGWKAELSEPICEFVSKFQRRKSSYNVRLCDPNILKTFTSDDFPRSLSKMRLRRAVTTRSSEKSLMKKVRAARVLKGRMRQPQASRSRAGIHEKPFTPSVVNVKVEWATVEQFYDESEEDEEAAGRNEEEVEAGQNGNVMEEDDTASLVTTATQEETELRRLGIQVENFKPVVEARMDRFSNAFMLRVKNEIRKLKRSKEWDRNVNRSPLACYLHTEIFKVNI